MKQTIKPASVLLIGLVAAAGPIGADVVTLEPSRDNTLFESQDGQLSNGAGQHLFCGITLEPGLRRALLAFDIAGNLPAGATVTGVELTLHSSRSRGHTLPVGVHRMSADWGEGASDAPGGEGAGTFAEPGDATWLHSSYDGEFWTVEGGDFEVTPSAALDLLGLGFYTWASTPALVADVQGWLDAPETNHGWMLLSPEVEEGDIQRFDSRENPDPAVRPLLSVEFETACEPSPAGQGYWHRQCLGVPEEEGGLDPRGGGNGPSDPTEPGFVEMWMPCADARLAELGFDDVATCDGMEADPPRSCRERALKKLTSLILDVCSGRLQSSCEVASAPAGCGASTIGDLVEEAAGLIHEGQCRTAARCAGGVVVESEERPSLLRDRVLSPSRPRPSVYSSQRGRR